MSGGTDWTLYEEACLAWQMGKRIKDLTFIEWKPKRLATVPWVYESAKDTKSLEVVFGLGHDGKSLWDSLQEIGCHKS